MDYVEAVELRKRHRPAGWWGWLLPHATCRACGVRWRCPSRIAAVEYIRRVEGLDVGTLDGP